MKGKNNYFFWIFLFVFLTTFYVDSNKSSKNNFLPLKKISITGNINSNKKDMQSDLNKFIGQNIILISRAQLEDIIKDYKFVKELKIKKIYPDKISIEVNEFKPLAIYINGNSKFILTDGKEKLRNYSDKKFDSLPLVFGKGADINFLNMYTSLKKVDFQIDLIKQFNYFQINRWDIILKNDKILKLPKKNYEKSLKKFLVINKKDNYKNFKFFDFRIKEQLILR